MSVLLSIAISVLLTCGVSSSGVCDNLSLCSSSPCSCSESSLNCKTCHNGQGCSECTSKEYFFASTDYKCSLCNDIFGDSCLHCASGQGCQQCKDGCNRVLNNECGIYECNCGDTTPSPTDNPTPSPTNNPTPSPTTPSPTTNPTTPSPTEDDINQLRSAYDGFWLGTDSDTLLNSFTDGAQVCWGEYGCNPVDWLLNVYGICNLGSISLISDSVSQNNNVVYSFYRACNNDVFGLFWINGMGLTKYDDAGLIEEFVVNFRDDDDVYYYLNQFFST